MKRYFTLEEAQAELPDVKVALQRLMELNKALALLNSVDISYEDDFRSIQSHLQMHTKFHKLSHDLYQGLSDFLERGVVVKDLDAGLIDFYSFFQGKEIFLCWKVGEEKITHWHTLHEGYPGRKPIAILLEDAFHKGEAQR